LDENACIVSLLVGVVVVVVVVTIQYKNTHPIVTKKQQQHFSLKQNPNVTKTAIYTTQI